MPKCTIDGKEVEFTPGRNLIEVAKDAGVEIPFFCYHPAMTVVAQCRMCYIEVGNPLPADKGGGVSWIPKLQTACSTPIADGMHIRTNSEKVKAGQNATMEFLLVNHPLDCPICDKSGECDLQDNSYKYGSDDMRTTEERRTYVDLDMGPVIKKNMNRCIHCTRCIRFGDEIAGIHEMVAVQRGNNTEITTIDGKPLATPYAGNYADICPTGSLTLKDFRFHKRAWMLKKTASVCEGCSKGCNLELHQDNNYIERCLPRENQAINKFWLCDEGRFNFRNYQAVEGPEMRVVRPRVGGGDVDWDQAMNVAKSVLNKKQVLVLAGSDLTQEELLVLKEWTAKDFGGTAIQYLSTELPGGAHMAASQDQPEDKILRRTGKTANAFGAEKAGLKAFDGKIPSSTQAVLLVRGGRAQIASALKVAAGIPVVGLGVFQAHEAASMACVLPGANFAEKDGTIFNFEGVEQKFKRAILPPRGCKSLSEIAMVWMNQNASGGAA